MKSVLKAVAPILLVASAFAQQPRVYTDQDYARAEKFMPYNLNPLVYHALENPTWMPDGRVWYRDTGANGSAFILIDPVKKTKGRAFDQEKLAKALQPFARPGANGAPPATIDPNHLPIQAFALSNNDKTVTVMAFGRTLSCDLSGDGVCVAPDTPVASGGQRRIVLAMVA